MLRFKGLDHVGLVVTDMDRTLRFYAEGLGLALVRRNPPDAKGVASAVLRVGAQELNIFCDPAAAPGPAGTPERIHHFCLQIEAPDIDAAVNALAGAGIAVARGPIERRDAVSLFVDDPDGIRVELALKR